MKIKTIRRATVLLLALCFSAASTLAAKSEWKARLTIPLPAEATAVAWSPDGSLLAVGHPDGRVTVWETKTGASVRSLEAHTKKVRTLAFAAQGDKLFTLGDEDRARIWSTADWSEKSSLEDVAFSFALSPDGRWLAAQDSKQALWLWDLGTLKRTKQLIKSGVGGAGDMSFSVSGQQLFVIYTSVPHVIEVSDGKNTELPVRTEKPDVKLKQVDEKQFSLSLGNLNDDSAMSHHFALSPNGALVAVGRAWYGKPAFADVLDLSTMKRVARYKPKDGGTRVSLSFDSSLLAIDGEKDVTLWKLGEEKQYAKVMGNGLVQFSPKSLELAVTNDNSLIVYAP